MYEIIFLMGYGVIHEYLLSLAILLFITRAAYHALVLNIIKGLNQMLVFGQGG